LLNVEGFRFSFFAGDGVEPPHVHVTRAGANAKVWLGPIRIQYAHRFTPAELRRLRELTFEHQAFLMDRWNEYFRG
jgi:hypothetical protein